MKNREVRVEERRGKHVVRSTELSGEGLRIWRMDESSEEGGRGSDHLRGTLDKGNGYDLLMQLHNSGFLVVPTLEVPMPYHPALDPVQVNLRGMPNLELGNFIVNLADAIGAHPGYQAEGSIPHPLLKAEELRQVGLAHIAVTKAAERGDRDKIAERDALRPTTELHPAAFIRWAAIRAAMENDPSLITDLSLPLKNKSTKGSTSSDLTAPQNPQAKHGKSGTVYISTNKVPKSHIYQVGVCKGDPSVENNWWIVGPFDHCRNMEVTGLEPGTIYYFRVMCIAGPNQSPWSAIISFRAM